MDSLLMAAARALAAGDLRVRDEIQTVRPLMRQRLSRRCRSNERGPLAHRDRFRVMNILLAQYGGPHLVDPIRPARRHIAISPHGGLYAMPSLCGSA